MSHDPIRIHIETKLWQNYQLVDFHKDDEAIKIFMLIFNFRWTQQDRSDSALY